MAICYTMNPERTGFIVMSDDQQQFSLFVEWLYLPAIIGSGRYPVVSSEEGTVEKFDGSFGRFPQHCKHWWETDGPSTEVFCLWTIHQTNETEYLRCRVNNKNFGRDDCIRNKVELLSTRKNIDAEKNKVSLYLKVDDPQANVFAATTTNWRLWRELLQEILRSLHIAGAKRV